MPCFGDIGDVLEISRSVDEFTLQWKIPDLLYLLIEGSDSYTSPDFDGCGGDFCLEIFPNGLLRDQSSDWVSLFFYRTDEGPPKTFNVTVGIKGPEGVENKRGRTQEFSEDDYVCHWLTFCKILVFNDTRLMQGNELTITVNVKNVEPTITKDASIQTEDDFEEVKALNGGTQSYTNRASVNEKNEVDEAPQKMKNAKQSSQDKNTKKISLPSRHGDVIRSLRTLLNEGSRADFTLKSGSREWPVHRAILEGRSGHLATLFRGEGPETDVGEVPIECVTDCDMDIVLHFIYTGEVPGMSVQKVCRIYAASREFQLEDLRSLCVEYMREEMCPEMASDALVISETCGERDLKESALECYFRASDRTVATEGWKRLKTNHPAIIAELFEETIKRERKKRRKE